ncbi:glucoamylase [Kribbella sp. ALI-6-A]|uniref:glucoamylase n=1 Tax=Kribbella sp. ALI-6-A TaxID=1933817 RepID=UPI00097C2319|nr:glucoamylase [Kribbella sp. ALI-6-A]ONI69770.1 glucoamylase [Kribbella sp. ALI-6-A]
MRDDSARRVRGFPAAVIAVLLAVLAGGTISNLDRNPQPQLVADGIPGRPLPAATATTPYAELVRHALADLDALTLANGATLAGNDGPWRFVWPRDASFVAAARCAIGQYDEAARVLAFLDRVRPRAGRWEARYFAETGGVPNDGREPQLDGSGWVVWATWFCDRDLARYWPMVKESADQIVAELGPNGLPGPSPDYWERPETEVTLGTVAPLLTGLRAGLAIARELGHPADAERWQTALDRLSKATNRHFAPDYPRTPARSVSLLEPGLRIGVGGGADAIVTILGPPFAPADPWIDEVITRTRHVLTQPNGGVTPGEQWRADGVAWTPQTALFALSAAARGDRATAEELLRWLDTHRTPSGALPEKVNRDLQPAGEAPLGWTSAVVVLTVAALDRPLPVP